MELDFSEMTPFVLKNIRGREMIALLYFTLNLATLIFIIVYLLWGVTKGFLDGKQIFWQMFTGVLAGSIVIIPVHEILHGAAYRLLGAREIRFGVDFQQFIFFVTADRFPITRNQLRFLAMTPFLAINLTAIIATILWFSDLTLFTATLLLSHNIMCIGDFALTSYANRQHGKLYSYDEIEKKKSYFYGFGGDH